MHTVSVLAVLALALSCTLAFDVTLTKHWKLWKETHNKVYFDAEEHVRYGTTTALPVSMDRWTCVASVLVGLHGKTT
jgi:hypothetical protein